MLDEHWFNFLYYVLQNTAQIYLIVIREQVAKGIS